MSGGFTHETPGGGSPEWYTPAWLFAALNETFDLDPASPLEGPLPWIPAAKFLTQQEDGLATPWDGFVWLNPPYGRDIGNWTKKMANHANGILLVFSRTETEWFHRDIATNKAHMIFFMQCRIQFVDRSGKPPRNKAGKKSSPGTGSLLAAWGSRAVAAIEQAPLEGAGWYL